MRWAALFGGKLRKRVSNGSTGDESAGMDVSDIRSLGFWVSNLLMIVATILGVYLAASEGFKQAMQFRQVEESQHTYELLTALRAELSINRARVGDAVTAGLEKLPQNWQQPPSSQRYIWKTMQNVPETFRVPTVALNGIADYYQRIDEQLAVAFDSAKFPADRRTAFVRLEQYNVEFDETVITAIDEKMQSLKAQLAAFGVDPDS